MLDGFISSICETESECVSEDGAFALTATVTVKDIVAVGLSGTPDKRVQVITCALAEHENPLMPPPETNVRSGGSTSVTVIVGMVVAAVPTLDTETVYGLFIPAKKFLPPVLVLTFRSGNGSKMLNVTGLVVPPGVVTVMFWGPKGADIETKNVALMVPPLTVKTFIDTPLIGETVMPVAEKFVPAMTTLTVLPRTPNAGVMDVSVGVPGKTLNSWTPLVPLAVVTVMP